MNSMNRNPDLAHLVYPDGPQCDPSCPGTWSQYHDGYSWGYENAEREERKRIIKLIHDNAEEWDTTYSAEPGISLEYLLAALDSEDSRD